MPDSQQEYFDRLKNPKDYKKTDSVKTGKANQVLKSIQKSKQNIKSIINDSQISLKNLLKVEDAAKNRVSGKYRKFSSTSVADSA
jgi:predicted component of type VI protein secretion system